MSDNNKTKAQLTSELAEAYQRIAELEALESGRGRAEEELARQNEFLNATFEALPYPFLVIDAEDHAVLIANSAAGLASDDGKTRCYELTHGRETPCEAPDHVCPLVEIKRTGEPAVTQHTHYAPDGEPRMVEVHGYPLLDQTGRVARMIEYSLDITERVRAEEALRAERDEMRALLGGLTRAGIGMDVVKSDYRIVAQNDLLREAFGDAVGELCYATYMGLEEPCGACPMREALQTGTVQSATMTGADGRRYEVTSAPLAGPEGRADQVIEIVTDVTERKQAEEELRESEERYRHLFENLSDAAFLADVETGQILETNRAGEALLGRSRDEIVGMHQSALHPPSKAAEYGRMFERHIREGGASDLDVEVVTKDATVVPTMVAASVVTVQGRRLILGLFRDIAELRRAEEELTESEERFRALMEQCPLGIQIMTSDGRIVEINDAYRESWGIDLENLADYNILQDEQAESLGLMPYIERAFAGEALVVPPFEYDARETVGQGRKRWFQSHMYAVKGEDGELRDVVMIHEDITEHRRVQEQLETTARHLGERVKELNCLLVISSLTGEPDISLDALLQQTVEIIAASSQYPEITCARIVLDGQQYKTESFEQTAWRLASDIVLDGEGLGTVEVYCLEERPESDEGPFLKEERRLIDGIAATLGRHLARTRAEEMLRQTAERLERSNQQLEQFAYVASHDLQEPLRMVASYTQLLQRRYKGQLDEDADAFIGFAVDGANRMQDLIRDLLAFSRVSTRGADLAPTDCEEALAVAVVNLSVAIEDTGAVVTHDALPTLVADKGQVARLFQNLVDNAIKFRGEEAPRIHVSAEEKGHEWVFSVRDSGIGIDPQYFGRVFVVFQRLHGKGEHKGTGIGLAISKRIVERHGGRIWIESEPGQGSTFYFSIRKGGRSS